LRPKKLEPFAFVVICEHLHLGLFEYLGLCTYLAALVGL